MIVLKETEKLQQLLSDFKRSSKRVGFVPTMGALHNGHLSLIRNSKQNTDITVCSLFVNPTQFNDPKDFKNYPSTLPQDILLLEQAGCDVLFVPSATEMYPDGLIISEHYELGEIEDILEGKYRPGHFQGVCQILDKLLNLVKPDFLYMGQKDYQQCLVVKKLVSIKHFPVQVIISETEREISGLALSSRNMHLTDEEKNTATSIIKMLKYIKSKHKELLPGYIKETVADYLLNHGFDKVDYVEIADADNLLPVTKMDEDTKTVALIAAHLGNVRLIDNLFLN